MSTWLTPTDSRLLDPPTPLAIVSGQRLRRGLDVAPPIIHMCGAKAGFSTAVQDVHSPFFEAEISDSSCVEDEALNVLLLMVSDSTVQGRLVVGCKSLRRLLEAVTPTAMPEDPCRGNRLSGSHL